MARQPFDRELVTVVDESAEAEVRRRAHAEGRSISNWVRVVILQALQQDRVLVPELPKAEHQEQEPANGHDDTTDAALADARR